MEALIFNQIEKQWEGFSLFHSKKDGDSVMRLQKENDTHKKEMDVCCPAPSDDGSCLKDNHSNDPQERIKQQSCDLAMNRSYIRPFGENEARNYHR